MATKLNSGAQKIQLVTSSEKAKWLRDFDHCRRLKIPRSFRAATINQINLRTVAGTTTPPKTDRPSFVKCNNNSIC